MYNRKSVQKRKQRRKFFTVWNYDRGVHTNLYWILELKKRHQDLQYSSFNSISKAHEALEMGYEEHKRQVAKRRAERKRISEEKAKKEYYSSTRWLEDMAKDDNRQRNGKIKK